jgi:hypothetical protein
MASTIGLEPARVTIDRSGGWRQDTVFRLIFCEEQAVGRIVEIGSLREAVEILDEPWPAPEEQIGRIKHQNGENVDVSFDTLQDLMEVARETRRLERTVGRTNRRRRQESSFPA